MAEAHSKLKHGFLQSSVGLKARFSISIVVELLMVGFTHKISMGVLMNLIAVMCVEH